MDAYQQKLIAKAACPKCSTTVVLYTSSDEFSKAVQSADMDALREGFADFEILPVETQTELSPSMKTRHFASDVQCPNCDQEFQVKFILQRDPESQQWFTTVQDVSTIDSA